MPETIVPMLSKVSPLPAARGKYGFEVKWDGIRAIVFVEGGRVRIQTRNLLDVTEQYPEVRAIGPVLGARAAIFDGEIVAIGENGLPSFNRLQNRMGVTGATAVRRRMESTPVTYMIFDVLYLDRHFVTRLPYAERRTLLESLELAGPAWQTPAYYLDGEAMSDATRRQGLEGIMAKELSGFYEPGKRASSWLKIKHQRRQELVIGGWAAGAGAREGGVGALLLGYYDLSTRESAAAGKPQRLIFAGKVGTGFTDATLAMFDKKLRLLEREASPFEGGKKPQRGARFVDPVLVAEVEFTEWTPDGILRHPSFKGLRGDKPPREVVREPL